jgi:hypothetical protein
MSTDFANTFKNNINLWLYAINQNMTEDEMTQHIEPCFLGGYIYGLDFSEYLFFRIEKDGYVPVYYSPSPAINPTSTDNLIRTEYNLEQIITKKIAWDKPDLKVSPSVKRTPLSTTYQNILFNMLNFAGYQNVILNSYVPPPQNNTTDNNITMPQEVTNDQTVNDPQQMMIPVVDTKASQQQINTGQINNQDNESIYLIVGGTMLASILLISIIKK